MTTPPLDLTALTEIAHVANDGPWDFEDLTSTDARDRIGPFGIYGLALDESGNHPCIAGYQNEGINYPDARHIAAFDPPTVLALIARVTAAESSLARYIVERTRFGDAMASGAVAPVVDAIMRELTADSSARAEAAEKAVAAVREIHPRVVIAVHESHGEEAMCPQCQHHWPCPTIAALDTHTPETETTP